MLPYEADAVQDQVTATRPPSRTLRWSFDTKLQLFSWARFHTAFLFRLHTKYLKTCFLIYSQLEETFVLLNLPSKPRIPLFSITSLTS